MGTMKLEILEYPEVEDGALGLAVLVAETLEKSVAGLEKRDNRVFLVIPHGGKADLKRLADARIKAREIPEDAV